MQAGGAAGHGGTRREEVMVLQGAVKLAADFSGHGAVSRAATEEDHRQQWTRCVQQYSLCRTYGAHFIWSRTHPSGFACTRLRVG